MDTRRFRRPTPPDALAAARWLGWVTLMMFVLVQTVQSATAGTRPQLEATGPQPRALSQATAQFDPQTHLVTVEAPAPTTLWNATPAIGSHSFVIPVRADAVIGRITAPLSPTPDETSGHLTLHATAWIDLETFRDT